MTRRIDHLVVGVRDLEAASDLYQRLGFEVGARNHHPWGTQNRLVQFGSSFIELITVGNDAAAIPPHRPRAFSFGAFVRDFLREREGFAMLVLDSTDARADGERFAAAGIGDFDPFRFERKGRRPDGSETHVAFSLAFAVDEASPGAGFFVCQQHYPENFWDPTFQWHPNGATNVVAVTLASPQPGAHDHFLDAFTGVKGSTGADRFYLLDGGRIEVRESPASAHLSSFTVAIRDLGAQKARLSDAVIPFEAGDGILVVPPGAAHGIEIRFEQA